MKTHWTDYVTRRGWIVLIVASLIALSAFTFFTRDICWTGAGYGSCKDFVAQVTK